MKKRVQKPARDTATVNPVTEACLERVRGGATAIEYGLLVAVPAATSLEPTTHP